MITVNTPVANQPANVNPNGQICADGTAAEGGKGGNPTNVNAIIYQGNPASGTIPQTPPAGSSVAALTGQNWSYALLGGAVQGSDTLVVWASYDNGNTWPDRAITPFQGQPAQTTDCG
jgi:hypothetical protein